MKIASKVLLLLLVVTSLSYSSEKHVDGKAQSNTSRVELQAHIAQLSKPIADFVNDFETWSQEDRDKMVIFNNDHGMGYVINGRPAATDKYQGSIGYYLDCRLDGRQIVPFLSAIDYLKQQKQAEEKQAQ